MLIHGSGQPDRGSGWLTQRRYRPQSCREADGEPRRVANYFWPRSALALDGCQSRHQMGGQRTCAAKSGMMAWAGARRSHP